jgi:hypothetical protein
VGHLVHNLRGYLACLLIVNYSFAETGPGGAPAAQLAGYCQWPTRGSISHKPLSRGTPRPRAAHLTLRGRWVVHMRLLLSRLLLASSVHSTSGGQSAWVVHCAHTSDQIRLCQWCVQMSQWRQLEAIMI